jgi:CheY-like chemotaxis protein
VRVLVVDDDEDVRALLELSLTARDHRVVAVADAATARLEVVRGFDALLVDVTLPDLPGPQLVAQLRSSGDLPERVVLLSALPIEQVAQGLGVVAVSKPFTPAQLDDALARAATSGLGA